MVPQVSLLNFEQVADPRSQGPVVLGPGILVLFLNHAVKILLAEVFNTVNFFRLSAVISG